MTAIPAPCGSNKQQSVRIGQSAWASVELIPPHFLSGIGGNGMGAIMHNIIYCGLLIATWVCSTASLIWVLNFGGLNWVLIAGGCVASFISSVALVEELVEWHRHSEALPVQRQSLPPASW